MKFSELVVLLPCHSLDDFPFHHEGSDADGLLAAWSGLWHPALLAEAAKAPTWQRVDSPPADVSGWLIVVPEVAAGQLPVGFLTQAREAGATLVSPARTRGEILAAAMAAGEAADDGAMAAGEAADDGAMAARGVDAELVADFYALGLCRLLVDLLARQRYYTTTMDEPAFARELQMAAQAALAGNGEEAKAGLTHAFQMLSAGRQYFYPAESYFIDLTLVAATTLGAGLAAELSQSTPINLLIPALLLGEMERNHPVTWQALAAALDRGTVSLVGGEQQEYLLPLVPIEDVLANLRAGLHTFQQSVGRRPKVFGRRRYGLATAVPQILDKLGFQGALHVTLDDGRFPLRVQSKIRWQGGDTSAIDAVARLPRDAAQPQTFLDLPRRLADAMDTDHVVTIVLAHWPGLISPWYADLRRIARYTNALGRFVTLEQYFAETYAPGEHARFLADEYRSPYLKQAVAAGEPDPLSQIVGRHRRWGQRLALGATTLMAEIAGGRRVPAAETAADEDRFDATSRASDDPPAAAELLQAVKQFAAALPRSAGPAVASSLVVNPLSFRRSVVVGRPDVAGAAGTGQPSCARVEVPALGFAWIDWSAPAPKRSRRDKPVAEGQVLSNEFFQLTIDPATGGIQRLDDYRHRSNRLSQQLALRTPGDAALASRLGQTRDEQAVYSQMQAEEVRVSVAEFERGEITSRGRLVDAGGKHLAGFVQRTRVERGSRLIHLTIELDPLELPPPDPWHAYYAARFAWDSAVADLWRGVHLGQHPTLAQQIEAPEYIEIESGSSIRTAILTCGLPYHRRSGPRILDSILIVPGETARRFELGIGVDLPSPAVAAAQCLTPPAAWHEMAGPPAGGTSGWLFHIDTPSVLATAWETLWQDASTAPAGFRLRLLETGGKSVRVTLRVCRPVVQARRLDFYGQAAGDLEFDSDQVFCELAGHEWVEIEAFW